MLTPADTVETNSNLCPFVLSVWHTSTCFPCQCVCSLVFLGSIRLCSCTITECVDMLLSTVYRFTYSLLPSDMMCISITDNLHIYWVFALFSLAIWGGHMVSQWPKATESKRLPRSCCFIGHIETFSFVTQLSVLD